LATWKTILIQKQASFVFVFTMIVWSCCQSWPWYIFY